MNHVKLLPAVLLTAIISGCVSKEPPPPPQKMAFGVPDGTAKYKPVSAKNLSLQLVGKPTAHAGERTVLTFMLTNTGMTKIEIPEWYSNESDNIVLFAQPWLTGMKKPDDANWVELSFDLKRPVFHHPLILMPDNKVMVAKELPFVKNIRKISKGMERRYFIKAKVNLKSLKLESDVLVLRVLPNNKTGEK
ncbi:MAG: hypothetical protein E7058_05005 [Lentisphaerae bacterium]|nr:hypothetical protein [Lentisphaerota bacterium]